MEGIELTEQPANSPLIDLKLIGRLEACTSDQQSILPSLRKATAIFVILVLTEGHSVARRYLAGLLWSRNDPAQALARLRDALHTLRHSIREVLGDSDLVRLVGDRVMLRPGSVRVDVLQAAATLSAGDIAADLDGLDPALDEWLSSVRSRFRAHANGSPSPNRDQTRSDPVPAAKRGSVIGVCLMNAIGMPSEDYLPIALGRGDRQRARPHPRPDRHLERIRG